MADSSTTARKTKGKSHPSLQRKAKVPRLTLTDRVMMAAATLVLCCLLLQPVLTTVGFVVLPALALIAFINPYSGLIMLAGSQIMRDPPGFPITAGQMAFLGFVVSTLYRRYEWRHSLAVFKRAALPFAVWIVVIDLLHGREFHTSIVVAFIVCGCACVLLSQPGVRTDMAVFALCLGSVASAMGWWGHVIGLHVSGAELTRRGLARIVTGRLGGISAFPAAMATVGCLGLATWPNSPFSKGRSRVWMLVLAGLSALSIPGAMGRGALLALVFGVGLLLAYNVLGLQRGAMARRKTFVIILACCAMGGVALANRTINTYLMRILELTQDQAGGMRSVDDAAKKGYRTSNMARMLYISALYPITGAPDDEVLDTPWGVGTKWQLMDNVPHNAFLGRAMAYGYTGLFFFLYFFCYPLAKLWRMPARPETGTLLGCHGVFFILFMFFPFGSFKIFYLLWAVEAHYLAVRLRKKPAAKPKRRDDAQPATQQRAASP